MMKPNAIYRTGIKCANPICGNRMAHNRSVSYFSFPKNPDRCAVWIKHCCLNVPIRKQHKLCGKHFETKMFLNDLQNRLRPNAIPTLFANNMPSNTSKQLIFCDDRDGSSMDCDMPDQPFNLETPVPISNFAHNDHDYRKRSDPMKLTSKAVPSVVICPDNDKQKNVATNSDLKVSQIPESKCYDKLADHTYAKFTKSSPFKEISTEKCIDSSTYMIQTLSKDEKIIGEQCVLNPSKSNKPKNIPSSKYIQDHCTKIIESIKNPPGRDWREFSLAQSITINDLRKKVKGLQHKVRQNNLKLEKFKFYKLHYKVSQLNKIH